MITISRCDTVFGFRAVGIALHDGLETKPFLRTALRDLPKTPQHVVVWEER